MHQLDSRMEKAVESYNLANVKLEKIRHDLKVNAYELTVARSNLKLGQDRVAQRLVELYTTGGDGGTVAVILGARNLDDLMARLDTVDRVSSLDAQIVKQVRHFREATARHAKLLREAKAAQVQVVAQRAAEKASVEGQLAQRQRLLASVKDEIARIQAAEAARQVQLQRQARARIEAQQTVTAAGADSLYGAPASTDGDQTGDTGSTAPPPRYGGVVGIAMQYLGVKYVWGGASPSGFDCSGLISYAYGQLGVSLPHSTYALWNLGSPVSRDALEPGDIVFFDGLGHAGIYIGGGQFVHAPHTGDVVKISSMGESWYASTYVGARRI